MWNISVKHEGLNAFRVVRGATKGEAELKAKFQLAAWQERWADREERLKARQKKLQVSSNVIANKLAAQSRSDELEWELKQLASILTDSLQREPFQWVDLKDISPFVLPCPKAPAAQEQRIKPLFYATV